MRTHNYIDQHRKLDIMKVNEEYYQRSCCCCCYYCCSSSGIVVVPLLIAVDVKVISSPFLFLTHEVLLPETSSFSPHINQHIKILSFSLSPYQFMCIYVSISLPISLSYLNTHTHTHKCVYIFIYLSM